MNMGQDEKKRRTIYEHHHECSGPRMLDSTHFKERGCLFKQADDASCQNKVMKKGRMLSRDGVCHTMTPDMTCL
jgi:hypothetical protein